VLVLSLNYKEIRMLETSDPTGASGWSTPKSLTPWLGKWSSGTGPGPGRALSIGKRRFVPLVVLEYVPRRA
jgi:hypothetical protein